MSLELPARGGGAVVYMPGMPRDPHPAWFFERIYDVGLYHAIVEDRGLKPLVRCVRAPFHCALLLRGWAVSVGVG